MKDEKIKTAEEILNEFIGGSSVFGKSFRKTCLAAMNKYASQFQSPPQKECGLPTESEIYIEAEKFAANFIKPLDLEIHERPAIKGNAMACFSAGFKKAMSIKVDDKDEEINRLKSEIEIHCNNVISIGHENMKLQEKESSEIEALKAEIKELKDRMKWISVEDRLPECHSQHGKDYGSGYLLGYSKYNEVVITQLWNDKEWDANDCMENLDYITNWMPLPLPPTKTK